ncbi:MAG: hypothetical protein R8P61_32285 [Bacteroidia bacterium]|nr:hypothetical protein [Bacteroidia bacterium]
MKDIFLVILTLIYLFGWVMMILAYRNAPLKEDDQKEEKDANKAKPGSGVNKQA